MDATSNCTSCVGNYLSIKSAALLCLQLECQSDVDGSVEQDYKDVKRKLAKLVAEVCLYASCHSVSVVR